MKDRLSWLELLDLAGAGQPLEILVGQPRQHLDAPQLVGKRAAHSITSS